MSEKEIEIFFKPDGTMVLKASGFKGKSCIDVAKVFESEFVVEKLTKTHEYYEPEEQPEVIRKKI